MSVTVTPAPEYPADDATFEERLAWMLLTYGFCARLDRVVKLYEPSSDCLMTRPAFTFEFKPWHRFVGEKTEYVAAFWAMQPMRASIRGYRMRPDRDFPNYWEAEEEFKNTYLKPVHTGAGEIQPWRDYAVHLLPAEFEREWFLDWLAHKWLHPEIPGIAPVMVAQDVEGQIFGTGRGMLRDIMQRLLGVRYAKHVDFDVLTGKSAQSVYTDFLADVILLMIDEAKDTADASRWSERRAVFERLKSVVDPRAIERSFLVKGQQRFFGLCFAAVIIFTNNLDALQIPPGDRRFGCLANGGRMPDEMAKGLQAWMDNPANIAALARELEARDLSQFNPYEAPVTLTKTAMQELATSERDEAFIAVRRKIGKSGLFTGEQFSRAINAEVGTDLSGRDDFKFWTKQRLRAAATSNKEQFRMPRRPDGVRPLILSWRDYNGPDLNTLTLEQAQEQVVLTQKILNAKNDEQAELLRKGIFQVVSDEAGESDEAAE